MPVYEYDCQDCDHITEALRRMSEADEPIACESCGGRKTNRRKSVFAAGVSSSSSGGGQMPGGCCPCGQPGGSCPMG